MKIPPELEAALPTRMVQDFLLLRKIAPEQGYAGLHRARDDRSDLAVILRLGPKVLVRQTRRWFREEMGNLLLLLGKLENDVTHLRQMLEVMQVLGGGDTSWGPLATKLLKRTMPKQRREPIIVDSPDTIAQAAARLQQFQEELGRVRGRYNEMLDLERGYRRRSDEEERELRLAGVPEEQIIATAQHVPLFPSRVWQTTELPEGPGLKVGDVVHVERWRGAENVGELVVLGGYRCYRVRLYDPMAGGWTVKLVRQDLNERLADEYVSGKDVD